MSLLMILMILSGSVSDDFEFSINNVHSTYRASGTFLGFMIDDNVHPVLDESGSLTTTYWSTSSLMDYFLSLHQGETVTLTITDADCYLHATEETMRLKLVTDVSAGDLTFTAWKASVEEQGSLQEVLGNYYRAPYSCRVE